MTSKAVGLRYAVTVLCSLGCLLASRPGLAHPLGNFSISHYTSIRITQEAIELRYILDLAEIPTFQELQDTSLVPEVGHPSLTPYLTRQSTGLREGLRLEVNGQRLALQPVTSEILFPLGAGGLPTMKLSFLYHAPYEANATAMPYHLRYHDGNFPGRTGWQEVVAVADSEVTIMQSSVPDRDRSQALTDYPTDLLNSPPQVLEAVVFFSRGGAPLAAEAAGASPASTAQGPAQIATESSASLGLAANAQATPRSAFTELITAQHLSAGVVLLALVIAAGLGALHALEPGHGKTVVAAYLVGTRGTARHALYLGLVVTATHTAGVYLLGAVTLYASHYIVPERLYPWLGVLSGLIIAGLGGYLFLRRYAGLAQTHAHSHAYAHSQAQLHAPDHAVHTHDHAYAHSQAHAHAQAHHHASEPHQYASSQASSRTQTHQHAAAHLGHHHHLPGETVTFRELVTLGITGGMVPCPAALVVLLSAVAMHRIGFGLLLIVAFSVGLAAVLVAIGLLMVYARQFMARFQGEGPLITRWLPLASAAAVTVFGVAMTIQALVTAGVLQIRL